MAFLRAVSSILPFVAVFGLAASHALGPQSLNSDNSWGAKAKDCLDIRNQDYRESGVYTVYVGPYNKPVQAYCDLETDGGGWLVFQRRQDGFENFYRGWNDYANGFGDLYGEFWLGNQVIHLLTNQKPYVLRVELADFGNISKVAEYARFKTGSAFQKYRLDLSGYSGNASDALSGVSGTAFSTHDQDNDSWPQNCAQRFKGAWWYTKCHSSNLNGFYHGGNHSSYADGVNWGNYHYSYPLVQMKIRPAEELNP